MSTEPSPNAAPVHPDGYRDFVLHLQSEHSVWQSDDAPFDHAEAAANHIAEAFPGMSAIVLAAIEWRAAYDRKSITRMRDANLALRAAVDAVRPDGRLRAPCDRVPSR